MVRGFAAEKDLSTESATHPTGGCQCVYAAWLVSVIFTWHTSHSAYMSVPSIHLCSSTKMQLNNPVCTNNEKHDYIIVALVDETQKINRRKYCDSIIVCHAARERWSRRRLIRYASYWKLPQVSQIHFLPVMNISVQR